ncbi:D-erythronate dehydrogenase [Hoeflea poritis]|uniref:SDR family oxidoreductase n=1 Tax=Hoeflea poritis TaxID=2993659 RepID=A0ABT4VUQ8_9HYPH|nr:D-erythronate dehydrogenase [Hoeflea poritis]MDA4848451.1 SDR family oxidoreductase [Hoeflea poritis]
MKILIIGAAGMVGRKLVARLCADRGLAGKAIDSMLLYDIVEPEKPDAPWVVETGVGDLSDPGEAERLVTGRPDVIFHLAAVVSGEAETDFDKGYRINLEGTHRLFEAVRALNDSPRLVFASSIAVFGAPFPEKIGDEFLNAPLSSYGTQKACCELLLSDYSRRGFFDGLAIRLPTVVVRPGRPNKAASGFFSNILREPLAGQEAVLPVSREVRHWMVSPRAAAGFLVHAAAIDTQAVGPRRALTMPGVSVTVAEMIEALDRVSGEKRSALIREEPDELVNRLVSGWPRDFNAERATELGFTADSSIDDIIRTHIEEEMGGKLG